MAIENINLTMKQLLQKVNSVLSSGHIASRMGNTLTAIAKNYKLPKKSVQTACMAWIEPVDAGPSIVKQWRVLSQSHGIPYHIPYGKKLWTLHLARYILKSEHFYWSRIEVVTEYISSLGSLKLKTAKIATLKFLERGSYEDKEKKEVLRRFLTCMRVRVRRDGKKVRISPAVDEELFNEVVPEDYHGLIDFSSAEVQEERERQLNEDQSGIWDVNYSKDAALAAHVNYEYFRKLGWEPSPQFKVVNPKSKPTMLVTPPIRGSGNDDRYQNIWSIHEAMYHRRFDMVFYLMYLLPEMMTLPMFQRKTFFSLYFSHKWNDDDEPPKVWEERMMLEELDKLGCDFNARNYDGTKAIESAVRNETIKYLKKWGCTVSDRDENGASTLELHSIEFHREAICKILEIGVDLLDPNPNEGCYWMPWVIHNRYYEHGGLDYMGFQEMVRNILRSHKRPEYGGKVFQEILCRPIENCIENDSRDLLASVKEGNISRVKVLLALGAQTNHHRNDGQSCMVHCSETGNIEMATLLLNNFADPNCRNEKGENCFRIAVQHGHFELAKVLHKFGSKIDFVAMDGLTVTHVAYLQNSEPMLQFCLDEGCDVNVEDMDGFTVQMLAFRDGKDSLGELLQEKYHGDINNSDNEGNNLADYAFRDRNIERLKYLAKRGIKLEWKRANLGGRTFFMEAVVQQDQEMCEALLEMGANINAPDKSGCTPLMHTIQTGDVKFCQFLLDKGCDPNLSGGSQLSPLMVALDKLEYDIAGMLLDHQADINGTSADHCTALLRCVSATNFQRKTFDFLLSRGCDTNCFDNNACCALSILLQKGRYEEAHILLERDGTKASYPYCGEQEPIVIALRLNDRGYWFHELVKHGANAMNEKVPVLNEYLEKDYFSFDVLEKLAPYNLAVGYPLQIAMEKNMNDVVLHLVNNVDDEMLKEATRTKDPQGRTPLLQAMHCNYDFVPLFCKKKYNCRGRDSDGFTPICLAAKMEDMSLTNELYCIVGPKGAAVRDDHGRSALTYAANNGWETICDDWFIDEISLDCNDDRNGIIDGYRHLLRRQKEALADVKRMLTKANNELKDMERLLASQEKKKEDNLKRAKAWGGKQPASNRQKDAGDNEKRITKIREAMGPCRGVIRELERRVDRINDLSRQDLLRGFNYRELLSDALFRDIPRGWR